MMRAVRLSQTVNDFLDYARPRQPKQDLVDVGLVLDQVLAFLEGEMGRCGVSVQRQCAPGLFVHGDKDLLYRAFYNILVNGSRPWRAPARCASSAARSRTAASAWNFWIPAQGSTPPFCPICWTPSLPPRMAAPAGPAHCAVHYHQPRRVNRAGERSRRRCAGARAVAEGHTRAPGRRNE